MVEMEASDLFLRGGSSPSYRVHGKIHRTDIPAPDESDMTAYVEHILTPLARERFDRSGDMDLAYTVSGNARFRINLFLHGGRIGLVARLIPLGNLDFGALNLPETVQNLADAPSGLILVVGPTGCGKSTTLAAMIHHINQSRHSHIVTIEDPIEFVHDEINCLIHHRQVGFDTESFAVALKHVVRQNPDIIMIGEMRDRDTVQTALSAALTGHLILSTLHTTNVVQSVDRMLSYYPAEARMQAQSDIGSTLVGIISMRLLPRKDGRGRIPALEILRGTSTVKRIITEGGYSELYDIMKRSEDLGMCTFNQTLVNLCNDGIIDPDAALRLAPNPDEFKLNMQGMFTGIDSIDLRTEPKNGQEEEE